MKTHKEESAVLFRFVRSVLIGLVVGAAVTLLFLLVFATVATYYDIPAAIVIPLATVANAIGAFTGGFVSGKANKRNGWLFGTLSSLVLFVFSTASGLGMFSDGNSSFLLVKALIMLGCGMVGGIFAVNTRKQRKKR